MTAIAAPGASRPVDAAGAAAGRRGLRGGPVALGSASIMGVGAVAAAVVAATDLGVAGWVAAVAIAGWAAGAVVVAGRAGTGSLWAPLGGIAVAAATVVLTAHPGSNDAAGVARAIAIGALLGSSWHLAVALPTGRLGRRRVLVVLGGYGVAATVGVVLALRAPSVDVVPIVVGSLVLATAAQSVVVRTFRRADSGGRARLQWAGCGVIVAGTVTLVAAATAALTGWPEHLGVAALVASVALPVAVVVGCSPETSALAARALVHSIVVAGLVLAAGATFVLILVAATGVPSGDERSTWGISLVAAALIAVAAVPVHRGLEASANRRVHGDRTPPDVAVRTFADRMTRAVPMDELLRQLAETLRATMRLHAAEVWTGGDGAFDLAVAVPDRRARRVQLGPPELDVAARTPTAGAAWLAVWVPGLLEGRADRPVRVAAVAHLGTLLGFIVVERRADDVGTDDEHDLALADVARHLALALHNVRLDAALQASLEQLRERNEELVASRARIVASADESRRRIERNLHDGAQQHLVAMAVKVGLVRQMLDTHPDRVPAVLDELRGDVQVTLTELRELAHGIYPPLLRSRGLPEALAAAAQRAPLAVTVRPTGLVRVDPDVEAAVYFCCLEAIQNAAKHAGTGAQVTVAVSYGEGVLRFEVADDGAGFDDRPDHGGLGFVSMTDRLGAIGGTLVVRSTPGVGTTVSGEVPVTPVGT
ncbi:MAG: histidine kinase [Ilumatobacteraceae bacterium]